MATRLLSRMRRVFSEDSCSNTMLAGESAKAGRRIFFYSSPVAGVQRVLRCLTPEIAAVDRPPSNPAVSSRSRTATRLRLFPQ